MHCVMHCVMHCAVHCVMHCAVHCVMHCVVHEVDRGCGALQAEIAILCGRSACFQYQLTIGGEDIERDLNISAPGLSADIGTHLANPNPRPNPNLNP